MDIELFNITTPDQIQEYGGCRFLIVHKNVHLTVPTCYATEGYAWRWAQHYAQKHFPGVRIPSEPIVFEITNFEMLL